jgi:hypothetical protein
MLFTGTFASTKMNDSLNTRNRITIQSNELKSNICEKLEIMKNQPTLTKDIK